MMDNLIYGVKKIVFIRNESAENKGVRISGRKITCPSGDIGRHTIFIDKMITEGIVKMFVCLFLVVCFIYLLFIYKV
jgi:hypothetical protein